MLRRCYNSEEPRYQSYGAQGVKVCDTWHNFQNFCQWYEDNIPHGYDLDKDLIGDGKIYSPETCIGLPCSFNTFLSRSSKPRIKSSHSKYRLDIWRREGGKLVGHYCLSSDYEYLVGRWKEHVKCSARRLLIGVPDKEMILALLNHRLEVTCRALIASAPENPKALKVSLKSR